MSEASAPRLVCNACGREHPWSLAGTCSSCAGLLDVEYDLARARIGGDGPPAERFRDLLPLRERDSSLDFGEGNTRCFHARRLGAAIGLENLWVKVEGDNPTRTVKDRQGTIAIAALRELGVREFVTASTGNSCTSMARVIARFPDMHMHVFVGDEFLERVAYADAPNVTVYWLPNGSFVEAGAAAGWFAGERGLSRDDGFFFYGRREGLKTVYHEAALQVRGDIEYYFQGVSSGVGVYAADRAARELRAMGVTRSLPRLVCVQEDSCAPMVRSFDRGDENVQPDTLISRPRGLAKATLRGDPSRAYPHIRAAVLASGGTMVSAPAAALERARLLAAETEGLDICHASALTIAGAEVLARTGRLTADAVVLLNLTGADRPRSNCGADFIVERGPTGEWIMKPAEQSNDTIVKAVIEEVRRSQQLPDTVALDASTPLLETGLALDSVGVLELLLAVETRFSRHIEESEVTVESLATIGALARLVAAKLAAPERDG